MLLVDTYNVLHVAGALPPDLAGLDPPGLAALILVSRYSDREVKLVCDGTRRGEIPQLPGIEFLFSGPGREADELIERIIRAHSAPRRLLVVSSDRRITGAARRRRAPTLASGQFLGQLAADRYRERRKGLPAFVHEIPLDRYSVDAWLREFGLDSAGAPRPSPSTTKHGGEAMGPRREVREKPAAADATRSGEVDPVLREAQQEWPGQVGMDDLDMRKWLGELHQDRHRRPVPPRGRGRRDGV